MCATERGQPPDEPLQHILSSLLILKNGREHKPSLKLKPKPEVKHQMFLLQMVLTSPKQSLP